MSMFLQQMAVSEGAVQSQNTWQSSGDSFGDGASSDTSHSLIADKGLLIALMSDNVSEKNLNNFGRFDALKDSVDKTKAKAYFDKQDGVTLPPFKLNMRIEQFLKQFIFAQADDLLSDVVDVPDDAFE